PGQRKAKMRVLKVDADLDLTLIEVDEGPFPVVCPVAPPGHKPSANVGSVGYPDMQWPAAWKAVHILSTQAKIPYTRERPGHGMAGGGLIDLDEKVLLGVTSFYEGPQTRQEILLNFRGGYVSLDACWLFLGGRQQPQPKPEEKGGGAPGILRLEQE